MSRFVPAGEAAVVALKQTFEQLDVLADAGAMDAGGRRLLVLLDALCLTLIGVVPVAQCTSCCRVRCRSMKKMMSPDAGHSNSR